MILVSRASWFTVRENVPEVAWLVVSIPTTSLLSEALLLENSPWVSIKREEVLRVVRTLLKVFNRDLRS